jgi:hypothetical protein
MSIEKKRKKVVRYVKDFANDEQVNHIHQYLYGTEMEEFSTWVDDEEPTRESAIEIVRRLLGL